MGAGILFGVLITGIVTGILAGTLMTIGAMSRLLRKDLEENNG